MALRVLIVDDHEAVRRGVRGMLEADTQLQVVAEAVNGEDAVQQTKSIRPDLIIMDVGMPVRNGLSAAAEIKRSYPETLIVMFSGYGMPAIIAAAKELGVNGYVAKDGNGSGLLEAIDAVIRAESYFPSEPTN